MLKELVILHCHQTFDKNKMHIKVGHVCAT